MSTNYAALSASNGSGEAIRATVQSPGRSIGSTSIPVNAITNWPSGTFIATTGTLLSTGKLNPATVQVFYGTASGTTITITAFASGYTDKGNAIGDVVVLKPTTEWANIVATGLQSVTQFPANFANFVEPAGGVWTQTSGLVGAQTAGNVWYGGVRSAIPVVTSKTFTASKDTYVDFNPSAVTFTYVAATNGATEPAVTASCVRVAKVVTSGSAITSVSQTQYSSPRTGAIPYNPYKFSVWQATLQSVDNSLATVIKFDTTIFDTGANYNASTGKFTAPVAGFYYFNTKVGFASATYTTEAALAINGTLIRRSQAFLNTAQSVSGFLQLAANDYVQTLGYSATTQNTVTGTDKSITLFEGFLVSEN